MSKLKYKYKAANEDGDLKHSFSKYVVKGNFCDVTLVSDDYQHFPAHKQASPTFPTSGHDNALNNG